MQEENTKDLIKSIEHFQSQHLFFNVQVTTFNIIRDLSQAYVNIGFYMAFWWFKPEKPLKTVAS